MQRASEDRREIPAIGNVHHDAVASAVRDGLTSRHSPLSEEAAKLYSSLPIVKALEMMDQWSFTCQVLRRAVIGVFTLSNRLQCAMVSCES